MKMEDLRAAYKTALSSKKKTDHNYRKYGGVDV